MTREAANGAAYMLSECAQPRKALVTLVAKEVPGVKPSSTEPIYGTRYGVLPLRREVEAWSAAKTPDELGPPPPNPFIPKSFELKASGGAPPEPRDVAPRVLASRAGLRLHFLQDCTFKRPKANAYFLLRSSLAPPSADGSVVAQLFQSMVGDALQDTTYQAGLGGLGRGPHTVHSHTFH